ncbi:hypothetical protein JRO89_XS01G0252400 [Xanthoceras sorbifolium]|uniref:Shikimate dehydrogenase n=1 Tax=Xanthoceras sorbifolium TaxID=99658 RepID=A0ABQ8ILS5_9ROSI|nr:hypothetical protein JRO89_XS01G0252400 [Xanthoceras sorbifolium]
MAVKNNLLICTQLECKTTEEMVASMEKAKDEGADLVELCIDSMALKSSRSSSRGGCKNSCLQVLRLALDLDVQFVEMDYEVASDMSMCEHIYGRSNTKVIVSSYVNGGRPSKEKLGDLIASMQATGADVIKLEIAVDYITDLAPIFDMLTHCQVPLIAMAVGSRGLISQLLGPKFGGFLVYGSLGGKSVPGLPSLVSLKQIYKLEHINVDTKVFGLVSNPVGHSKGPILHNPAFRHTRYNGIYVPMLVDDVEEFFRTYTGIDFAGFSVGIPHKEAAVACCDEVHPLAKSIGAVNTIIRRPIDGKLIGYNTDCEASICAIEDALRERQVSNGVASHTSLLAGKTFVLVGAGGAGRALAFGAKSRGARVVIFNRDYGKRQATKCLLDALKAYELVFDAVYTPRNTRLLREAAEVGAIVVSGVEMFIRQALGQFRLFTGGLAPEDFMRKLVLEQF